jgi:methyl-accepting chemotaxis protein
MNEADGLLDFLTDGLVGRERDAVTRAFFQYAAGDPNSHPVGISVLLTACMRKLAQVPEKLQSAATTYQKVVADARELEKGLIERANRSNAGVVAEFKDEGNRIAANLRTASQHHAEIVSEGRQIAGLIREFRVLGETILSELRQLKVELKTNAEAANKIAEAAVDTKANSQSMKEIVSTLAKATAFNWVSVGVTIGFILTLVAMQLPWYLALALFTVAIGLLQALGRAFWKSIREKAEQMKTS